MIEAGFREELNLILKSISLVSTKILDPENAIRQIHSTDIDFHFDRKRNYDLTIKSNFIATLLAKGFNGRHVIKESNAFSDPEQVWTDSRDTIEAIQNSLITKESSEVAGNIENTSGDPINQTTNSPIIDGTNTSG